MKKAGLCLALLISIAAATPAHADTTCALNGSVLEIDYTQTGNPGGQSALKVAGSNAVVTSGGTTDCTVPLTSISSIDWDDTSTDNPNEFYIDFSGGPFIKPFAVGDNEIPIDIAAGTQNDLLLLTGGPGADLFNYGTEGVNLNPGETAVLGNVIDEDLTFTGVESHIARGGNGNDELSGAGGAGNGAAFSSTPLSFEGQTGDDELTGGTLGDDLSGESSFDAVGDDEFSGGLGSDKLRTAGGDDTFDPGAGTDDWLAFTSAAGGVTIDLSKPGAQQTGLGSMQFGSGFDRVFGSSFDDVLLGSSGPETINGSSGNDVVGGRGGSDFLIGWDGDDTLLPRDGVADNVQCDTGADPGTDTVAVELVAPDPDTVGADCESRTKIDTSVPTGPAALIGSRVGRFSFASNESGVSFECSLDGAGFGGCASPFSTAPVADGGHMLRVRARDRLGFADATAAQRSWSVDTTAPALTALSASRKVFRLGKGSTPLAAAKKRRARRGTRISFRSSEAGTARLTVTPLLKGRKVGKRCLKATRKRRKRKRCTRLGRAITLTRAVKAGTNTIPFTGRLGSKALKPGSHRIDVSLADGVGNRAVAKRLTLRIVK